MPQAAGLEEQHRPRQSEQVESRREGQVGSQEQAGVGALRCRSDQTACSERC